MSGLWQQKSPALKIVSAAAAAAEVRQETSKYSRHNHTSGKNCARRAVGLAPEDMPGAAEPVQRDGGLVKEVHELRLGLLLVLAH